MNELKVGNEEDNFIGIIRQMKGKRYGKCKFNRQYYPIQMSYLLHPDHYPVHYHHHAVVVVVFPFI